MNNEQRVKRFEKHPKNYYKHTMIKTLSTKCHCCWMEIDSIQFNSIQFAV